MAGSKLYRINLVRDLRKKEMREELFRRYTFIGLTTSLALLFLALVYGVITAWNMELVIDAEKKKLLHVRTEYQKYTAARMIVDKSDVELLDNLHGRGILWTKKLAAMANHLPEGYSITGFTYRDGELKVKGYGLPSPRQDQLLVLDGYLKKLRKDSTFSDIFVRLYLNNTERKSSSEGQRILFEFSALTANARRQP